MGLRQISEDLGIHMMLLPEVAPPSLTLPLGERDEEERVEEENKEKAAAAGDSATTNAAAAAAPPELEARRKGLEDLFNLM